MASPTASADPASRQCWVARRRYVLQAALVSAARSTWHGVLDGPFAALPALAVAVGLAALLLLAVRAGGAASRPDSDQTSMRRGLVTTAPPADHGWKRVVSPSAGPAADQPLLVLLLTDGQSNDEGEFLQLPEATSWPLYVVKRVAATAEQEAQLLEWVAAIRENLGQAVIVADLRQHGLAPSD